MSKKTISIICLTAIYTIFFYDQHVGINFLIFTISMLGLFFLQYKEAFKEKSVLFLSFAAIFTASFAAVHGSNLSLWATIISLMVIPGVIINKRSNLLVDFSTSLINIGASTTFMIIEMVESGKKGKGKGFLHLLKYLVPIVFIIAFFFIYRAMNPLFENFTQEIAEIISLGWVFFTLGGFILTYSIFKQKRSKEVDNWASNWLFNIDSTKINVPKWNETVAFTLLFIVLNLMLISVNVMDINYLYIGEGMPDGITHKQFLHKGVGMVILSILLGISILLYFFRGSLNFSKNNKTIKILAFLWVIQNVFMVVSTTLRNNIYVDDALLSYKRIGVYFWLLFALIGLVTLFFKLYKNKTVWFLAKHNFKALFLVLILSSVFDWDMIISDFNLNRARQVDEISSYDKTYLLSLSEGNIAGLYSIRDIEGFEVDSVYSYSYSSFDRRKSNATRLDCKVYDFLLDDSEGDWRSYSARRNRVRNEINQLHEDGQLHDFNLEGHYITSLEPIYGLTNIKELNISSNNFSYPDKLVEINELTHLEKLYLNDNYIYDLDTLTKNTNLTHLYLSTNELKKLSFLKNFKNLDLLDLNNNKLKSLSSLPALTKLESLYLNGNQLNDIMRLSKLPNLEKLSLNNISLRTGKFPLLKRVSNLSLSNSQHIVKYSSNQIESLPSLKILDLSHNQLTSLSELINTENQSKFPLLTSLSIGNNKLRSLHNINKFKQLTFLDLSNNEIYNAYGLEENIYLKELYLANNKIQGVSFLENMQQLKRLDLSSNYIKNVNVLSNLNMLNYLNLSNTGLKDIQHINSFDELQTLNLIGCRIKDWKRLKNYKTLETLSVSFIKKEDATFFKQMKSLKNLHVLNTEEEVIELLKIELPDVSIY
ncbi:MAG: DUF4173 domain-containing protein [Flavobacteriales bacterium]|nr:DUF4173 domain-containing protein [Flavobacteriales bacterium]